MPTISSRRLHVCIDFYITQTAQTHTQAYAPLYAHVCVCIKPKSVRFTFMCHNLRTNTLAAGIFYCNNEIIFSTIGTHYSNTLAAEAILFNKYANVIIYCAAHFLFGAPYTTQLATALSLLLTLSRLLMLCVWGATMATQWPKYCYVRC